MSLLTFAPACITRGPEKLVPVVGQAQSGQEGQTGQTPECQPEVKKVSDYHAALSDTHQAPHIWIPTSAMPPMDPNAKFSLAAYYGDRSLEHIIGDFTKVRMDTKYFGGTLSYLLEAYKTLAFRFGIDAQSGNGSYTGKDVIDLGTHKEKRYFAFINPELKVPLSDNDCTYMKILFTLGAGAGTYNFDIDDHLINQKERLTFSSVGGEVTFYRIIHDLFKMGIGFVMSKDYFSRTVQSRLFTLNGKSYNLDVSNDPVIKAEETAYGLHGSPVIALGGTSRLGFDVWLLDRMQRYIEGPKGFEELKGHMLGVGVDYSKNGWDFNTNAFFDFGDFKGYSITAIAHTPKGLGFFIKYYNRDGRDSYGLINLELGHFEGLLGGLDLKIGK